MADKYVSHANAAGDATEHGTGSAGDPYNLIQSGVDNIGSGDICHIKADAPYLFDNADQLQNLTIDIDGVDNKTVQGYYSAIGDQNIDGDEYKGANGWVVLNMSGSGATVFEMKIANNSFVKNLNIINSGVDIFALTQASKIYLFDNIKCNGGDTFISNTATNGIVVVDNCELTGSWIKGSPPFPGIFYMSGFYQRLFITNSVFTITNAYDLVESNVLHNTTVFRNSILNVIGIMNNQNGMGFGNGGQLIIDHSIIYKNLSTGTLLYGVINGATNHIMNSIIANTTNSITAAGIYVGGYNCFYNNGSDRTLLPGDIQTNPLFVDAENGDFRMLPGSPCFNTGKPMPGNGFTNQGKTSMGVFGQSQRGSILGAMNV